MHGEGSAGRGYKPVIGFCEHNNEPSGFRIGREFYDHWNYCKTVQWDLIV
jgi:hypothetical protein